MRQGMSAQVHRVSLDQMSGDQGKAAIKNLVVLDSLQGEIGHGGVLCMSGMTVPLDDKNRMIPIKAI